MWGSTLCPLLGGDTDVLKHHSRVGNYLRFLKGHQISMYPVPSVFAVRKLEKLCKYPFFQRKKVIYQADLWVMVGKYYSVRRWEIKTCTYWFWCRYCGENWENVSVGEWSPGVRDTWCFRITTQKLMILSGYSEKHDYLIECSYLCWILKTLFWKVILLQKGF